MDIAIVGIVVVLVVLPLLVASLALPLCYIIDAAKRSTAEFENADGNKTLWIVLPFVFGIVAAIVYLAVVRPKLRSVR